MTGVLSVTLPVPQVRLTGVYHGPFPTDTSNADNGRDRGGRGVVTTVSAPVAGAPTGRAFEVRYDKAVAHPTPDMDDGLPT